MDDEMEGLVKEMCNLSDGVFKAGKEEGATIKARETAKKMIARGRDSWEEIADLTGLSLSEVEELARLQPA